MIYGYNMLLHKWKFFLSGFREKYLNKGSRHVVSFKPDPGHLQLMRHLDPLIQNDALIKTQTGLSSDIS